MFSLTLALGNDTIEKRQKNRKKPTQDSENVKWQSGYDKIRSPDGNYVARAYRPPGVVLSEAMDELLKNLTYTYYLSTAHWGRHCTIIIVFNVINYCVHLYTYSWTVHNCVRVRDLITLKIIPQFDFIFKRFVLQYIFHLYCQNVVGVGSTAPRITVPLSQCCVLGAQLPVSLSQCPNVVCRDHSSPYHRLIVPMLCVGGTAPRITVSLSQCCV